MNDEGATIRYKSDSGQWTTKSVPNARSVFDFPDAYPEAGRPGAII